MTEGTFGSTAPTELFSTDTSGAPASAQAVPNTVFGMTKVRMSLSVKSQKFSATFFNSLKRCMMGWRRDSIGEFFAAMIHILHYKWDYKKGFMRSFIYNCFDIKIKDKFGSEVGYVPIHVFVSWAQYPFLQHTFTNLGMEHQNLIAKSPPRCRCGLCKK